MASQRHRGFTLIELLVVIAIIGILASMVFPVFAKARESGRKAVCLSNIKNIGLAVQMYLADNNDTLPTAEHRQEVHDFFEEYAPTKRGRGLGKQPTRKKDDCTRGEVANPYLRWPVVLDEYVKNRDVWQCPSARLQGGASVIVPNYYPGGWLGAWQEAWAGPDEWWVGPCWSAPYPTGWGGTVTDSFAQQRMAVASAMDETMNVAHKAFIRNYAHSADRDLKMVEVEDSVKYVAVADGGYNWKLNWGNLAYPDYCSVGCNSWAVTPHDVDCSVDCAVTIEEVVDPAGLNGKGRHLDGSNLGFLDGHAAWYSAKALRDMAPKALLCGGYRGCPYAKDTTEPEFDGVLALAPETCLDGSRPIDAGFKCAGWP
jgi:prepilin-type N-terminal cleavage/methylation domain-containing protein/prepilin-type processing-associated H-X9-DG protein